MESSLASLFIDANLPSLPWEMSGESVEELQQQLISTSMELQSARDAAELQTKLNEAKVCRLQGLLDAARKERDEARMKCGKLQECLLHLSRSPQAPAPPSAAESPCSLLESSLSCTSSPAQFSHHSPASPTIDNISFRDPKQISGADEGVMISVNAKSLPHQAEDVQDIFALELNLDPSSVMMEDSQQQFSMDVLNDDVGLDEDESLDLTELQVEQSSKSTWEGNQSSNSSWDAHATNGSIAGQTLLSQTSCASSGASHSWGTVESPKVPTTTCDQLLTVPRHHILTMQPSHNPLSTPSPSSIITPAEVSRFANKALHPCVGTMQEKPTHLVEPFKCVANVVHENALPEKGKLLQAVMQAGPLLQNLLLAGPLPQWRYPPPQVNTVDIPRVPMAPSSMTPHDYLPSPLSTINNQVPMMQSPLEGRTMSLGHANSTLFADHRNMFMQCHA